MSWLAIAYALPLSAKKLELLKSSPELLILTPQAARRLKPARLEERSAQSFHEPTKTWLTEIIRLFQTC
jgi:hypothetical protein